MMYSEAHNSYLTRTPVPLPPIIHNAPAKITEIIDISVSSAGNVELQDVLGIQVRDMLMDVLENTGEQLGWVRDVNYSDLFIKQLRSEVEILIDTSVPRLPVLLRAKSTSSIAKIDLTQLQLQQLLEEVTPQYHRAMNELLDLCYIQAIETAAEQQGHMQKTFDYIDPVTLTHVVEITVTR